MRHDPSRRLATEAEEKLREVVSAALGKPRAVLGRWEAAPLQTAEARALYLLTGTAQAEGAERDWRVVLKVLAPVPGEQDPAAIFFWKREVLLYPSGLLDNLPPGLRAPRCFGGEELPDGTCWLWLEHVREEGEGHWPQARWALAARHLGRLNGAYLAGRPLPQAPWLGGGRLRSWLARHEGHVARIAAAPGDPAVSRFWPQAVVNDLLRLWAEREAFCDALERLPQTFGHGDAIRRNLFSRRGPDDAQETVAIDWEYAGLFAAGEEIGQTLSVASAFYDVTAADLPALDEALFAGYLEGLRDAGWRGDETPVRFACAAHAALRNAFNAVGTALPAEDRLPAIQQRFGRSWEELAEARAAARPFLLARAAEARRLMERF